MGTFSKPASDEQKLRWARIWFQKLCEFHGRKSAVDWHYSAEEVIAYLRSRRDAEVPAWKRMKIIEGLIQFRESVQHGNAEDLLPLKRKMGEIVLIEKAKSDGLDSIDDVVGKINSREPDAIQEFRRAMRRSGMAYATERSYVSKLKAFMADRALTCLADFERIHARDVEAHLTDLAVDGNVAPSTQNLSFHALLKFFTLVLKREIGKIEAIRANKDTMAPTVLSPDEVGQVFEGLDGVYLVIAKLLYGCGLRISEAHRLSKDPKTGRVHRHHLHSGTFPVHLRSAIEQAGLLKHVTSHTFRHCFATHLLWSGTDIRQIQQLLGHSDVKTTEIYTHVRNPHESKVVSPLDRLVRSVDSAEAGSEIAAKKVVTV